jgi:hypothetical protein
MNKKYDNNYIIIASRAYFLHFCPPKFVGGGGGAAELFLEICRFP